MKTTDFTRINNDINGNPRYVCDFIEFLTEAEQNDFKTYTLSEKYAIALSRAKTIGGKKFHNKQYGGGIVFQSYNIEDDVRKFNELMKNITT